MLLVAVGCVATLNPKKQQQSHSDAPYSPEDYVYHI